MAWMISITGSPSMSTRTPMISSSRPRPSGPVQLDSGSRDSAELWLAARWVPTVESIVLMTETIRAAPDPVLACFLRQLQPHPTNGATEPAFVQQN